MPRRHSGAESVVLPHGAELRDLERIIRDLQLLLERLRRDWVQDPQT